MVTLNSGRIIPPAMAKERCNMTNEKIVLQISNMTKQFPGVKALDRMQLTLHAGEVMAIAGENGAGKSTLMKILSGVYHPDEGEILLDGEKVAFATPAEAQRAGICTVHQELSVFPYLSITIFKCFNLLRC